jgi:hypothetical protein
MLNTALLFNEAGVRNYRTGFSGVNILLHGSIPYGSGRNMRRIKIFDAVSDETR